MLVHVHPQRVEFGERLPADVAGEHVAGELERYQLHHDLSEHLLLVHVLQVLEEEF